MNIDRAEVVVNGDQVSGALCVFPQRSGACLHPPQCRSREPDTFFIHAADGSKITDEDDLANLCTCLRTMLDAHFAMKSPLGDAAGLRPVANGNVSQSGLLHSLMDRHVR